MEFSLLAFLKAHAPAKKRSHERHRWFFIILQMLYVIHFRISPTCLTFVMYTSQIKYYLSIEARVGPKSHPNPCDGARYTSLFINLWVESHPNGRSSVTLNFFQNRCLGVAMMPQMPQTTSINWDIHGRRSIFGFSSRSSGIYSKVSTTRPHSSIHNSTF